MGIDLVDHDDSGLVPEVCWKSVVFGLANSDVCEAVNHRLRSLAQYVQWHDPGRAGDLGE